MPSAIAGMVVGAAGLLLTLLMVRAINRSVANVIFAKFGGPSKAHHGTVTGSERPVKASDVANKMRYAASMIIVPGYGIATQVYVVKRGQGAGYAGVVNDLFYLPNYNLVCGDARAVMGKMIEAARGLAAVAAE